MDCCCCLLGEDDGTDVGEAGGDGEDDGMGGSGGSSDEELEGVLKDLDGEILAEREIIRSSSGAGSGGGIELPTQEGEDTADGAGGTSQTGQPLPRRAIPQAPAPPRRGYESVPDDIPDAKDDDIIARQLREAAMQEEDPELKEKLWEEYRKYKKG